MATPPTTTPRMSAINLNLMALPTSALMDVDAAWTHRQVGAHPSDVCIGARSQDTGLTTARCAMTYDT